MKLRLRTLLKLTLLIIIISSWYLSPVYNEITTQLKIGLVDASAVTNFFVTITALILRLIYSITIGAHVFMIIILHYECKNDDGYYNIVIFDMSTYKNPFTIKNIIKGFEIITNILGLKTIKNN